jgi:hypothetical protein
MPLFRSILAALLFVIAATGSAAVAPACPAASAASACCDQKHAACTMAGLACGSACAPATMFGSHGAATAQTQGAPLPFSPAVFDGEGRMIRPPLPPPRAAGT